jgi:hypothetical protein
MLRCVLRQVARLSTCGLSTLLSSFIFGVPIVVESLMSGTVKWRYKAHVDGNERMTSVREVSRMLE